jgi:hypothetical protein
VTDFTLADETHVNNVAVPDLCTVITHHHSAPPSEEPSSSSSFSEENLQVLIPTGTYSRIPLTLVIKEPVQVHSHEPPPHIQNVAPASRAGKQGRIRRGWHKLPNCTHTPARSDAQRNHLFHGRGIGGVNSEPDSKILMFEGYMFVIKF